MAQGEHDISGTHVSTIPALEDWTSGSLWDPDGSLGFRSTYLVTTCKFEDWNQKIMYIIAHDMGMQEIICFISGLGDNIHVLGVASTYVYISLWHIDNIADLYVFHCWHLNEWKQIR